MLIIYNTPRLSYVCKYKLIDCSGVIKYVSVFVYVLRIYFSFSCSVSGGYEKFVRESGGDLVN